MSHQPTLDGPEPQRKRKRLTHACNLCRSRKVKCDERLPRCTNCVKARVDCITIDPRRPNILAERREAQRPFEGEASPTTLEDLETPASIPSINQHLTQDDSTVAEPSASTREEGLLLAMPRFTTTNSLLVLTQWLDLAFTRIGLPSHFSVQYTRGRPSTKASVLLHDLLDGPLLETLRQLETIKYLESYLTTVNAVFPIFDRDSLFALIQLLQDTPALAHIQRPSVDFLVAVLVISASSPARAESSRDLCQRCLSYGFARITLLLEENSLRSAQAFFLMAVVLRGLDEMQTAWHMLTLAISVAQSLGIHLRFSNRYKASLGEEATREHANTWWSIYVLEKVMCLELGRTSSIRDFDCSQEILPPDDITERHSNQFKVIQGILSLARVQSEVSEQLIVSRHLEESGPDLRKAISEKIKTVVKLDQKLIKWADSLPHELRYGF